MDSPPKTRVPRDKKSEHIYSTLREMILSGARYQVGDKLPSENDLVRQFGASRPTVARVLGRLQEEGLVRRRMGSGTFITLEQEHSGHIFGLLIPELGVTEIFESICQGISRARSGSHHDLLWGPIFDPGASVELEAERLCEYFVKRRVSGVFFAPLEPTHGRDETNQRIADRLDAAGIPTVLLDRDIYTFPRRSRYDLVGIDNLRAGFVITEHVMAAGARRPLFLGDPRSVSTVQARMLGFISAIQTAGKAPPMIDFAEVSKPEEVRSMLARHNPDAIVCVNDVTAARLMTTLYGIGRRVPEEIKVTGVDNVKYAAMLQVPLTTIDQPCAEIGATALMAMLDRLAHPDAKARDFSVDFTLVVRQSTQNSGQAADRATTEGTIPDSFEPFGSGANIPEL